MGSYNSAVSKYKEHKNRIGHELLRGVYEEVLNAFISNLNNKYGYPIKQVGIPIARGKGKKHDYSDLEKAYNNFTVACNQIKENGMSVELTPTIDKCIQTWELAIAEYQPKTKKARIGDKNIGYINYNLAGAFFMKQEWDVALEYLIKVKNTKGQHYIACGFEEIILDLKKRYSLQN